MDSTRKKPGLLGVGLDNEDGHVRVTRGDNFHLVGGSRDTHESMQEKCISSTRSSPNAENNWKTWSGTNFSNWPTNAK